MAETTAPHGDQTHHVVPLSIYGWNFAALMVLLGLTLVAARYDLGVFNTVIALSIAVAKALLIVLYFMHMRWSSSLVRLFAAAALFWLLILFVMTLDDYLSRPWFSLPLT
jgi:cytochrome c oxidase subunit 4